MLSILAPCLVSSPQILTFQFDQIFLPVFLLLKSWYSNWIFLPAREVADCPAPSSTGTMGNRSQREMASMRKAANKRKPPFHLCVLRLPPFSPVCNSCSSFFIQFPGVSRPPTVLPGPSTQTTTGVASSLMTRYVAANLNFQSKYSYNPKEIYRICVDAPSLTPVSPRLERERTMDSFRGWSTGTLIIVRSKVH